MQTKGQYTDADLQQADAPPAAGGNTNQTAAPKMNVFDRAMQTEPITKEHPIKSTLNNLGAGAARVVFGNDPRQMARDLTSGNPTYSLGESLIKPFVENPSGEAVAAIPQALMMGLGGGEAGEPSPGLGLLERNPLPTKYRSPLIPEGEAYSRAIADKLGVHPFAYEQTVSTLGQHGPLLRDYLRSQAEGGAHLGDKGAMPLEVSKAATNLGQEGTGFYQRHLIQPNEMQETGQGPLGEAYGRVTDINKEINPDYRKGLTIQTDAAQARHADLGREASGLNKAIYNTLSYRSGMSPEEVQGINQRGASLQSLGDEARAAQRDRALGQGEYSPQGIPMAPKKLNMALQLLNTLRGGEEAIRGRKIGTLLERMPGEAQPLPDAERIQQFRNAATQEDLAGEQGRMGQAEANQGTAGRRLVLAAEKAGKPTGPLGPTEPPKATVIPPPENYEGALAAKMKARAENIASGKAAARAKSEANVASSQARKEGLTPTEPPQATVVEPPENYAQDFVNRIRQRAGENRTLPTPEPAKAVSPMDKYLTGARERQGLLRKEKK